MDRQKERNKEPGICAAGISATGISAAINAPVANPAALGLGTPQDRPRTLTPAQRDGVACVACGREGTAMLSVTTVGGMRLFACIAHPRGAYALIQVPASDSEPVEVLGVHTTRKAARAAGDAVALREHGDGEYLWSFARLDSVPGHGAQVLIRLQEDYADEDTAYQVHPWADGAELLTAPTIDPIADRLGVKVTVAGRRRVNVYKNDVFLRQATRYAGESDESLFGRVVRDYLHPEQDSQEWELVIEVLSGSRIAAVPATEETAETVALGDVLAPYLTLPPWSEVEAELHEVYHSAPPRTVEDGPSIHTGLEAVYGRIQDMLIQQLISVRAAEFDQPLPTEHLHQDAQDDARPSGPDDFLPEDYR